MSDIVERLRDLAGPSEMAGSTIMREAADEIDRLRMEVRAMRQDDGAVIAQLQNDVRALREALKTCRELRAYDRADLVRLGHRAPGNIDD